MEKIQLEANLGSLKLKAFGKKRLSVSYLKCYHIFSIKRKSFDNMKIKFFAVALIISAFCFNVFGQTQASNQLISTKNNTKKKQFFPLSELKPGMKGTAHTVFRGSDSEKFNVEILGLLPSGIGPKQDLIIGKISGGEAERTRVFAGMSGSPVYIDGKLVGAISYSYPFSKEAICGITPIEQMISIFEKNQNNKRRAKAPKKFSFAELAATEWKPKFSNNQTVTSSMMAFSGSNPALNALAGQTFQRISTPITFSGISQNILNEFKSELLQVGLLPVSAAGGAAKITPLKKADATTLVGGDSVSMQLTRGDISMSAAGTVTLRDGEKIYAFGHPFLSLGSSDLPMSESSVVIVVPSVNNSFKLAVPNAMVGSMTQDRATGVFGKLGKAPKMIPVKLNLTTSRGQTETLNFEIANDETLAPLLLNISILNSIAAQERGFGESTIEVDGEIKLKGQKPVKIESRSSGVGAPRFASFAVVVPVANLLQSRFDDMKIDEINVNVSSMDGSRRAVLERIEISKNEVQAGDDLEVQAFIRTDSGKVLTQKIPLAIPVDTPTGKLKVVVGDGNSLQTKSANHQFVPSNLSELVNKMNSIKKNDRLYVQTYRVTKGAIIGSNELPNLPPSVLATLKTNKATGSFKPIVETVLTEKELAPAEYMIFGQQTLEIEVVK